MKIKFSQCAYECSVKVGRQIIVQCGWLSIKHRSVLRPKYERPKSEDKFGKSIFLEQFNLNFKREVLKFSCGYSSSSSPPVVLPVHQLADPSKTKCNYK